MARAAPWIAIAVLGFSIYCLYPGWYSFDSATLLNQARTGAFSDHQPPGMAAAWRGLLSLGGPPGLLLVVHLSAFVVGATMLAHSVRGPARLVFPLVLLWPPFLAAFGHLWTDVALVACLVLTVGWVAATLAMGRVRLAWLAVLGVLYAISLRHNTVFAVPPIYFLLVSHTPGWPRTFLARAGLAVLLTLASYGVAGVLSKGMVTTSVPVWTSTAIWDLAAVSVSRGELVLPPGVHGPALSVEELRPLLNPHSSGNLLFGTTSGIRAGIVEPLPEETRKELLGRWLSAPLTDTQAWGRHRLAVAESLFGIQPADKPAALFIQPVILPYADNPAIERNRSRANAALVGMAQDMRTTSWCAPALYLLLSMVAVGLTFRRGFGGDRELVRCLAASAWLYAIPLVVLAPSSDWRYSLWPMVSSALAFVAAFALSPGRAPSATG